MLPKIETTGLYSRLKEDKELLDAVEGLRAIVAKYAEAIARTVPNFTDHSIRHMDSLWEVTDAVLLDTELEKFTHAEAFLLASSFYLHDIGMAYGATTEGLEELRRSQQFIEAKETMTPAQALAYTIRQLHANAAENLSCHPIPGTDQYLFETATIRQTWGTLCGQIAASHHWSLEKIENKFGSQGRVPLPGNRVGDLGYVAAILRIVDYAHINRDRAQSIERAFRGKIDNDAIRHWLAQENIDGPSRNGSELVYHAAKPITDVDAWWLFFEMLQGLDLEIRKVKQYVDRRAVSQGRFSLESVRGSRSPEDAATSIPTSGFLPIEVHLRTGSIDRLVALLAGEHLYGENPMVPVRELIQNSRDAASLRIAISESDFAKALSELPIKVTLDTNSGPPTLEVSDHGVGMTQKVMTDYLISIASDYWTSQLTTDFPEAKSKGFAPAGKFGIGFLSAFMLGNRVIVESNREGGERIELKLNGLGRRGEIRVLNSSRSEAGTTVKIVLKPEMAVKLESLHDLVKIYAPMIPYTFKIIVNGREDIVTPNWLFRMDQVSFVEWVKTSLNTVPQSKTMAAGKWSTYSYWKFQNEKRTEPWSNTSRPEFVDKNCRLVASFTSVSMLCLKGLFVQSIETPGYVGIINLESGTPDVSRRTLLHADVSGLVDKVTASLKHRIIENIGKFTEDGLVLTKLATLAETAKLYGRDVLLQSSSKWICRLVLPGETRLVSCGELCSLLTNSRSLYISHGTGSWSALREWNASGPLDTNKDIAVVFDDLGLESLDYTSETKIGTLQELCPDAAEYYFFGTVIHLLAQAWGVSIESLMSTDGWTHASSRISGKFVRA